MHIKILHTNIRRRPLSKKKILKKFEIFTAPAINRCCCWLVAAPGTLRAEIPPADAIAADKRALTGGAKAIETF